jgi:2,3-bisphosphoglycerate-dependent phosphoglycerate mutase
MNFTGTELVVTRISRSFAEFVATRISRSFAVANRSRWLGRRPTNVRKTARSSSTSRIISKSDNSSHSHQAPLEYHSPVISSSKVVLLRHGQSIWNKIPTFSGWCDVPLTDAGIAQAEGAARVMKERALNFDLAFSSTLQRAYVSAEVVLETMGDASTPIIQAWQLNERHYGALQGLAKNNPELHARYGSDQMTEWRRSMMGKPPPMDEWHPHFSPPPAPLTESLYDCQQRVLRYWNESIIPAAAAASHADHHESTILIAAHANTIRALIAYLDDVSPDDVPRIHVPNSVPCVYKIDTNTGRAIQQDSSPLSRSRGYWMLCSENQERLVEKLGGNSEAFARSVFEAWDIDGNGVLNKEELIEGLSSWKRDANPAINALAGKIWEEVRFTLLCPCISFH